MTTVCVRAAEIAAAIGDERLPKVDIRETYSCGLAVVDKVYQIKGWKPLTKAEARMMRKHRSTDTRNGETVNKHKVNPFLYKSWGISHG